ncbi:MAG TPA: class I SAM-dependent methyltransferase [Candidatus Eisenbacteria bacterium]|nr:class I SAM-dependent methyltransferase [Candidatus Eisenbacteria bacterium]
MEHADLLDLIRDGVAPGVWAELGSGAGAFTLALADLLGAGGRIVSVDRDTGALRRQRQAMEARFPAAAVEYVRADFTRPLELPELDGLLMANSLHFVRRREPLLAAIRGWLRPGGRLLLVEYDADRGNLWVPHPLSYGTWERVAAEHGFTDTRLLARRPSRHLGAIYSALSRRPR